MLTRLAMIVVLSGCAVHRPSDGLACTTTAQCTGGRMCESGFCVIAGCPAICTSCNEAAHTCNVDCTSAATCGTVDCPSGWSCDITCTGTGACGNITCETGSTCDVACTDPSACGAVACSAACKCDLTCASGECGSYSCPTFNNGPKGHCTTDGTAGMVCRSTQDAACVKC